MSRSLGLSFFFILLGLVDWYILGAIKNLTKNLSAEAQRNISILFWSISVISLLTIILGFFVFNDRLSFKTRNWIISFIFILYSSKLIAAVGLILVDLWKAINWLFVSAKTMIETKKPEESIADTLPKIDRSKFLTQAALGIGALHVGAMTWGIISGAHDYRIRRIPLKLANLPKQFHGLKLIQISDIHSGSFFNKTAVEGGIDMLMAEKPDMVFFTGDLVNNESSELNEYFDIFKKVKAPLGVFSTLGNHDYGDYKQWNSPEEKVKNLQTLIEGHKLLGWDLLQDTHRKITVDGDSIDVLGIQNWGEGFKQMGDLKKALNYQEKADVKLLLSHDPTHWRAQVLDKTDISASFAGHTHGMQYGVEIGSFKWSPAQFRYKEWAGLYEENNQQLYVNRGYGYLGYPGRVGILPEITVFELQRA